MVQKMELWLTDPGDNFLKIKRAMEEGTTTQLNTQYENGITPLIWASMYGHLDLVKILIAKGVSLNLRSKYGGYTVLMVTSIKGHLRIVKFLISKGADLNIKNEHGKTASGEASGRCNLSTLSNYLASLKGPLSLQHIVLNLIEERSIPCGDLPKVLFQR